MGGIYSAEVLPHNIGTSADVAGSMYIVSTDRKKHIYEMVNINGGGYLIRWMRYARRDAKREGLHEEWLQILEHIKELMYQSGKGKLEAVSELVKRRNKERNERLGAFSRKKGRGKSGPNILEGFDQEAVNQGDLNKALKLLDGGTAKSGDRYREIVWKLDERGNMGESLVGCCLMQGDILHRDLALRLLIEFPKLVNDIMLSEDYYGLSPLHQAIVNEDRQLVSFLLRRGAKVHERCYGAFFCPDDQKSSRIDSLEHEYVQLSAKTNYAGRMYYGEYPLSFAVCSNSNEGYEWKYGTTHDRHSRKYGFRTFLIYGKMLKLVYDTGGSLEIYNRQNLTPLTLAAKLAKKNMFDQILHLECQTLWVYRHASSILYPLEKIDTINQKTGDLNEESALSLIVYGVYLVIFVKFLPYVQEDTKHLELLDGLIEDLLKAKWRAFARTRWLLSFASFTVYYIVYFVAFMSRPFSATTQIITEGEINWQGEVQNITSPIEEIGANGTLLSILWPNFYLTPSCHLWNYGYFGTSGYVRMVAEPLVFVMVIFQLITEVVEINSIGLKRWWNILRAFPSKITYKVSLLLVLFILPIRLLCGFGTFMLLLENILALVNDIIISAHFLFYCRAIKFVGPFVLMIYTIITKDLSRFFLIYLIFLIGFSQSFFIIFLACERANSILEAESEFKNIMGSPMESILRCFMMTIGEFSTFYTDLDACPAFVMSCLGKILFVVFEILVSLMQFNLLIAMMTRTYELIYETRKEWKRQWAQVILMIELSISPKKRRKALMGYSIPIGSDVNKRGFIVTRKMEPSAEAESQRLQLQKEQQMKTAQQEKRMIRRRRERYDKGRASRLHHANSHESLNNFHLNNSLTLFPTQQKSNMQKNGRRKSE